MNKYLATVGQKTSVFTERNMKDEQSKTGQKTCKKGNYLIRTTNATY